PNGYSVPGAAMMASCACFARRVKRFRKIRNPLHLRQAVEIAAAGYCAWGCFRYFVFVPWLWLARHEFGQRADDAVGLDGRAFGQALAMHVDPDRIDAEALRRHDLPFQIVADHPGVFGGDA